MKRIVFSLILLVLTGPAADRPASQAHQPFRHAYYLFQEDATGCSACYIPLLLTKESLEDLPRIKKLDDCRPILTYERDSIWQVLASQTINDSEVDVAARKIRFTMYVEGYVNSEGKGSTTAGPSLVRVQTPAYKNLSYRYQEVGSAEVIKLLQNPQGTIPISKPAMMQARLDLTEIITDFKSIK
jgi:hypothetical protein